METWEIELREKLNKELPENLYQIGVSPVITQTGKGGYINYLVAIEKIGRNYSIIEPGPGLTKQIKSSKVYKTDFTEQDFLDILKVLARRIDEQNRA